MMLKSKGAMIVGSLTGAFILIYGTAILFRLLFGGYLFEGGLANLNYALLALLCAVPFALIALAGRNDGATRNAVLIGEVLFSVLFVLVHLVLVVSAEAMDGAMITRTVAIFPVTALLLVVVLYFTAGKEKTA